MTIITRQTSGIGVSAKNSPLTHSELDQNLIDLVQGKLVALNVSSNVVLSNATITSANVDITSRIPGTFSVRTTDQLALTSNTVYTGTTVFVDITEIPANTTYTVESFGQMVPLTANTSLFEYDKINNTWLTVDGDLKDLAYTNSNNIPSANITTANVTTLTTQSIRVANSALGIVINSANGTQYRVTVTNDGILEVNTI